MKPLLRRAAITTSILGFVFGISVHTFGQRFQMGFTGGAILSQLDGDGFTGYDKLGYRFGIRNHAYLGERLDLVTELLWEEKGSVFESKEPGANPRRKENTFIISYAEIPVVLRLYHRRYPVFAEGGGAISYLVHNEIKSSESKIVERYQSIAENFNRYEFNLVLGGGYAFGQKGGVLFRTTIGVSHLFRDYSLLETYQSLPPSTRAETEPPIVQLRNYLISASAYYLL